MARLLPTTHNGYRIFRGCDDKASYKLHGMKDTIIYVTYNGYVGMTSKFHEECRLRNIEVRILV